MTTNAATLADRTTIVGTTIHDEDVVIRRNVAGTRYSVLIDGVRYSSGTFTTSTEAAAYACLFVPAHRRIG